MAKLTGQFTTPSLDAQNNKTHKPFQHGVVFIFTGATKVTRETDAKGKYSFDLTNGEYEVSVYLKGNTEKDRFDMRAGEKFVVTATTKADALDKWLQVIGNNGKDELATYYENLLAQMQKLYQDTKAVRDEMVGNSEGAGKWVRETAVKTTSLKLAGAYSTNDIDTIESGMHGVSLAKNFTELNFAKYGMTGGAAFVVYEAQNAYRDDDLKVTFKSLANDDTFEATKRNGVWQGPFRILSDYRTTVDSNGFIKAASPVIKLFDDKIEPNDSFKEKPVFEKMGTGAYKITNTLGLAKEGWYIETPKDKNGLPYFMVDWEQDEESHDVIIRVFKKKLDLETLDFVNGEPVDIGEEQRWIDLRFHEEELEDEELLTQLDNLDESDH